MSRPEFPIGTSLPVGAITRIREEQRYYDENPQRYEREEQAKQERLEEERQEEYWQQEQII